MSSDPPKSPRGGGDVVEKQPKERRRAKKPATKKQPRKVRAAVSREDEQAIDDAMPAATIPQGEQTEEGLQARLVMLVERLSSALKRPVKPIEVRRNLDGTRHTDKWKQKLWEDCRCDDPAKRSVVIGGALANAVKAGQLKKTSEGYCGT